jgi:hypothetical protein
MLRPPTGTPSLVRLYYNGGVSEEVLKAEQQRIATEQTTAPRWADAAEAEVEDVMDALEDALLLVDATVIYERLPHSSRRLVNQAVFLMLIVRDPDTVQAKRSECYEALAAVIRELQAAENNQQRPNGPKHKGGGVQNDHDPDFRGRGSYIEQMAGIEGRSSNTYRVWERVRDLHADRFGR